MRICLVYDCLFPWTIGGAERWYRALATELVDRGHDVTYLTRVQWDMDDVPDLPGVQVIGVSKREPLYGADGRRQVGQALRFGAGVLRHLRQNRRTYDVVHTCSFPYFSLLAARAALVGTSTTIGVDWFEVWSDRYWREYLGRASGTAGSLVQRLCARASPVSFVFSDLHGTRLRALGTPTAPIRLAGLHHAAPHEPPNAESEREPLAVFAGRHIAEKRAHLIPGAVAQARHRIGDLRGIVFGDGPERHRVLDSIVQSNAQDFVTAPGFVDADEISSAFARAGCMVLPSAREGYGLVVIEAAVAGTPTVVIAGEDNAAAELVIDGVNGYVARSEDDLGFAIGEAIRGGAELRRRTRQWYDENAARLSLASSAQRIIDEYEQRTGIMYRQVARVAARRDPG